MGLDVDRSDGTTSVRFESPTQDNTIEFPDKSGTVALLDDVSVNLEGYSETGTQADGDVVVSIGDHQGIDTGFVTITDTPNEVFKVGIVGSQESVAIEVGTIIFNHNNGARSSIRGNPLVTGNIAATLQR